nr:MAG: hypothetical protein [Coral holobiont-associated alphaflexivirus 2]
MNFINCEDIRDFFSNEELYSSWHIILQPSMYEGLNLVSYQSEVPTRRWVRPDGVQKWVIGNGSIGTIDGVITISVDTNGNNTIVHEATTHSVIGSLDSPFIIGRSNMQSRIDALNITVNELEVRMRSLSEESVRTHDRLREEQLKIFKFKENELDSTRLIAILRERVLNRDAEIVALKEDKLALEKRCVDVETSLEILKSDVRESESTPSSSSLLKVGWPIRSTEIRVTATPRLTICKQDTCVGSYTVYIVEETTFNITSDHWFSVEVTENSIKRMLVRWMSGFHPTAAQNGSAVSRQMPSYVFNPNDILELISRATGSNFFLTGFQTIKECDWAL